MEYNENNYEDFDYTSECWSVIDKWFNSDAWNVIVQDAEGDDQDSIDLMEEVSDNLNSLIFHLNNSSGVTRIEYEINKFRQLLFDFDV